MMDGLYKHYAILYNFSYMAIGALTPLIGQYLSYAGYNGAQIGAITATGTAVAIFASAFWGGVYSRSRDKQRVLLLLILAACALNGVLGVSKGFLMVLAVFGAMYFFQAPITSLEDAFTVSSRASSFGSIRTWGAIGFALGVFLTAQLADAAGLVCIFPVYIGSLLISAVSVILIGRRNGSPGEGAAAGEIRGESEEESRGFSGYLEVLRDRRLRHLIICTFMVGGSNIANNTYFSFLYIEGGGTMAGVGACMLIMVGAEAPFMAWSRALSNRFTEERMILAAMIVSALRFAAYGAGLPWWMLLLTGVSQGFVNGILLVEFVRYAAELAPKGCRSLAVSSYYVIGSNLSTIVCQMMGGLLLDPAGADGVYLSFAIMNAAGVILYLLFGLHKPPETA